MPILSRNHTITQVHRVQANGSAKGGGYGLWWALVTLHVLVQRTGGYYLHGHRPHSTTPCVILHKQKGLEGCLTVPDGRRKKFVTPTGSIPNHWQILWGPAEQACTTPLLKHAATGPLTVTGLSPHPPTHPHHGATNVDVHRPRDKLLATVPTYWGSAQGRNATPRRSPPQQHAPVARACPDEYAVTMHPQNTET